MYCRVLACDFDGTVASDGQLDPQVAAVLAQARAEGFTTLLVTGRVLAELEAAAVDFRGFDAVVAENGGVVWLPALARRESVGAPPPLEFLAELRARGIPFHAGAVVVGTWDRHAPELLDLIHRLGMAHQLVFNRAAVMVLPSGVDKGAGIRRALYALGRSERNMVAFGDAENDCPLLDAAEIGVAVRGAVPVVAAHADECLRQPGSVGVSRYIESVVARGGCLATPPRQRVTVGRDAAGRPVDLPASGTNLMVSGDPRSGKSWLAGLVAEHLLDHGYRLCVLDPEGDYCSLGGRPDVLVLGNDVPLVDAAVLPKVLHSQSLSLIVNLAGLVHAEKVAYVEQALAGLETARARTGMPHWILLDEAQYFLLEGARSVAHLESPTGNFLLVTYRPSLLAAAVLARMGAYLFEHATVEEERYFVTGLLHDSGPTDFAVHDALEEIVPPRAAMLVTGEKPRWQVFFPAARLMPHVHHGRKYADELLPESRGFYFLHANGTGPVARSVSEFCAAVRAVPLASLRHHLLAGDFSRWVAGVLGDRELAAGLRKLETTARAGAAPSRDEILQHVRDRYLVADDPPGLLHAS